MRLSPPPPTASWSHHDARRGFEVAFLHGEGGGCRITGQTSAREGSALWSVGYEVTLDSAWRTVAVHAWSLAATGVHEVVMCRDAGDRWTVNGQRRPELDGCADVDFESSAVTNTLPLHRLEFVEGVGIAVPAAFVRAANLRVERLEQTYTLTAVTSAGPSFHYEASTFDFECDLEYDPAGLVVEYPGIAVRDS